MKVLAWIGLGIGGSVVVGAVVLLVGLFSLSRNQPTLSELSLGVRGGEFSPCPETPNCVSTQAPTEDETHRVEPISYAVSRDEIRKTIVNWIQSQPRTKVITEEDSYIHAVFASSYFGFKDDLEIFLPKGERVVHVRSAARVGKSDLGVNRERYEALRRVLE